MQNTINNYRDYIALGLERNVVSIKLFGRNSLIDTTEDVINQGGFYAGFISTYSTVRISSSSALDTLAGTGARVLRIYGLNANFLEQTEDILLNGTTIVNSLKTFSRVYAIRIINAGSTGSNQGIINCSSNIAGNPLMAQIKALENVSKQLVYTIPANKRACITGYMTSVNRGTGAQYDRDADFSIRVKYFDTQVFWSIYEVSAGVGSSVENNLSTSVYLAPKTDIVIRVLSVGQNATDCSASMDIVLYDISEF